MAIKIYLAPSNQGANKYVYGNTNEMVVCNAITDKLVALLSAYNVEVKRGLNTQTIQSKAKEANAWGATVYLSIHTNAGGGQGTEVWYNPLKSGSKQFAQCMYNAIAPLSPGKDRGLKSSVLYLDVKEPKVPCCLCELAFHDNNADAMWLVNEQKAIAEALIQGLVSYTGMVKKAEEKAESRPVEAGMKLALSNAPLYSTATTNKKSGNVTGTYYLWSAQKVNSRYRITNAASRVGQAGQVTGWVAAKYVEGTPAPETETDPIVAGKKLKLSKTPLYGSSSATKAAGAVTGTYYLWSAQKVNKRYRITNTKARVGKAGQVTGWIDEKYL